MKRDFEAIVIGAGHAGLEASMALSNLGFATALITQNASAVARMSCNPSIGGLAKGNIVKEIDALGGQMALLSDLHMLQFKILNRSKGAAVQAPRAQIDKYEYCLGAGELVREQKNLTLIEATVCEILFSQGEARKAEGVKLADSTLVRAPVVVLTTGTFMEAKIFIGDEDYPFGRLGEGAAIGLGTYLRECGFNVGRLKTGTPARVERASIDYSKMEKLLGDEEVFPFSFLNATADTAGDPCWGTFTNSHTHEIIRSNIHRSPLYGGKIVGIGPRYCPSIEDKVMRFPDRDRHQVFIESEGLGSTEMYLNGLSSSLPRDVQSEFIHSVVGLENANILKPAYAVEYDYLDPRDLMPTLESKLCEGLFVAGQTNGTSGYEEAAGQGLIAGINAAQRLRGRRPVVLTRRQAYIGVLIDDLVTLGTSEPYRMFTSRAEYRLSLRADTADSRLTPIAIEVGLASENRKRRYIERMENIERAKALFSSIKVKAEEVGVKDSPYLKVSIHDILRKSDGLEAFSRIIKGECQASFEGLPLRDIDTAALDVKYSGYVDRENAAAAQFERLENMRIPSDFDYSGCEGVSSESKQKLIRVRPMSIGQAARISGIRQSDLMLLSILVARRQKGAGRGK